MYHLNSAIGTFGRAMFSSRMTLSHEEDHQEDLGNVDIATFVTIDSEELRRLSRELIILDKGVTHQINQLYIT